VGTTPDLRETVVGAYDGRRLFVGGPGEEVLSADDQYAIVRSADGKTVHGHELAVAGPRWSRSVDPESAATLTPYAVVVVEEAPDRIVALDPRTGRELANLRSSAKVLAVGPTGMVIGEGREIAYVRFGGSGNADGATGPGPGSGTGTGTGPGTGNGPTGPGRGTGSTGPGTGPTCGGPKNEQCPDPGADGHR
jgi:hypothetical protein